MITKIYELEGKVERLENDIHKLTVFTNALAQILIDTEICTPPEVISAIIEKREDMPR